MSAQVNNVENIISAAEKVCHPHEARPLHHLSGEASVNILLSKTLFSSQQRAQFYSGEDRVMLSSDQLERLYELEKHNDQLQREIFHKEHSLKSVQDPLAFLADIEHAKLMISRNTGEVLKIFDTASFRIQRIAELESQNTAMHTENLDKQTHWTSIQDMEERTHVASRVFLNKDMITRNETEIAMLRQESAA
jgi:hypothetical protein